MSKHAVAHNPLDVPVRVDDDGHEIPGGGFGAVRRHTDLIRDHLAAGRLAIVDVDPDGRDVDPAARDAARQAADLEAAEQPDTTPEPDSTKKGTSR